jgi:signal transduction histidine kinase
MTFPLRSGGQLVGVMSLGVEEGLAGTTAERRLPELLGAVVAPLLAQLEAERSREAANRSLRLLEQDRRQKLREISLLYLISSTLLSPIGLNRMMHLILTALTSGSTPFFARAMLFVVNSRAGVVQGMLGVTRETNLGLIQDFDDLEPLSIRRWDISEAEMECQRTADFSRLVQGTRFELSDRSSVITRSVKEGRLIQVSDTSREKGIDPVFVERFRLRSCAVAPLVARDGVAGLLVVDNGSEGRPLSREDLRFLQLFANQVGMAFENALLATRVEGVGRELREAQERLIQGEKLAAIGEMAASIAHELKNPLVSIGGFARRLSRTTTTGTPGHDAAERIVSEVSRLERMLADILAFSKQARICYSPCSLGEMVEDTLATMAIPLQEGGIRVDLRLTAADTTFMGDEQQIMQVLVNLFCNARDAMKQGGVLEVAVEETSLAGRPALALSVSDTGVGIPLEVLHNIFNPFFTTKSGGTGLGLPIVHRIVENHCGKINVTNRLEGGARFQVVLPVSPA